MVHKAKYDRLMVTVWDGKSDQVEVRHFYSGFHDALKGFYYMCNLYGKGYIVALRPSNGVKHGDSIRIRWDGDDQEIKGTI